MNERASRYSAQPIESYFDEKRASDAEIKPFERFTQEELLAIDRPRFELLRSGQSLLVPIFTRYLHSRDHNEALKAALQHFNLNTDLYHATENPRGMYRLYGDKYKKEFNYRGSRATINSVLKLLGTRDEHLRLFFGFMNLSTESDYWSDAFRSVLAEESLKREHFAFNNPDKFPTITARTQKIFELTGIPPHEIFNPGTTPPLAPWQPHRSTVQSKMLLDEALEIIEMRLTTDISSNLICKKFGRNYNTTNSLFNKRRVSDKMHAVLEAKEKSLSK